MPSRPIPDEDIRRAFDAWMAHGQNAAAAARSVNMPVSTFKNWVELAKTKGLHLSDGARAAVHGSGLSGSEATGGWLHEYDDDGKKIATTHWKAPKGAEAQDFLERVRDAFEGIKTAPPIKAPAYSDTDLLTMYPLFDVHFGMHAWGRETGKDDYDTKLAASDIRQSLARLLPLTPQSETAIVLVGGDFFHADDQRNMTPASGNILDVDGRHFKVLSSGIEFLDEVCRAALAKHKNVRLRVMRGNHDPHSHMTLTFALSERYRDEERMTVEKDPRDLFMFQWGRCSLFAQHGDKNKPQDLVLLLADVCPFWSETPHRYAFTGHFHHEKSKDIGGVLWESLRPFCPPDAWAAARWSPRRALEALTFHKQNGRVLRATDPVTREAV